MMRRRVAGRVGGRGVVGGRSVSSGGSGGSGVSRGVGLVVVGLVGFVVPVGVGLVLGTSGVAVGQETPEQRCARETAQWDAAQLALWQATHPGQSVPSPGPWPAYVCVGGPDVDVDVDVDADASVAGRPDRWGGQSIAGDGVGVSQNGQDVGAPRTGISRGGSGESGRSALESARSNVRVPVSAVEVVGVDGQVGEVLTVVDGQGRQVVVDGRGRTTGEVVDGVGDGRRVVVDDGVGVGRLADEVVGEVVDGAVDTAQMLGLGLAGVAGAVGAVVGVQGSGGGRGSRGGGSGRVGVSRPGGSPRPGGSGVSRVVRPAGVASGSRLGAVPVAKPGVFRGGGLSVPGVSDVVGASGLDGAPRATVRHLDGAEQTLFALLSPGSDHSQEFELDVPEGGQAVVRDDGGVDVVDADGNVVSQVDPPWAFDALGRPQETWYTYDPVSGVLTQHVEPNSNALYPIIADPNMVGLVDTTGREDGETWTEDLGNGEIATHTIIDGTGGQSVQTHTERADGSFSDIRSTRNDVGGSDVWSNDSDGSSHYFQNGVEQDLTYTASYDQDPVPGYIPEPVGESYGNYDNSQGTYWHGNSDGTVSTGQFEQISDNQYRTVTSNPDGSSSEILSTQRADGGVSTMVTDDNGTRITTDGVNNIPLDEHGNDISQSDNPDAKSGQFYNPDTGEFVNGAVVEGVDTPVYRMDDGSLVYGMNNDEGGTDWVTTRPNGESAVIRELDWAPDGSPIIVDQDPFVSDAVESATGVPIFTGADAAGAVYGIGTDTPVNMAELGIKNDVAAGRMSQEVGDDLLKGLKWSGRALGAAGTGLSIVNDVRNNGESVPEAVTTNTAGAVGGAVGGAVAGAAFVGGAAVLGVTAPVWGTAVVAGAAAAGAGWLVTKGAKSLWNWVAD